MNCTCVLGHHTLEPDDRCPIHAARVNPVVRARANRIAALEQALRDIVRAADDDPQCCALVQAIERGRQVLA
jgi:hypothetical protein